MRALLVSYEFPPKGGTQAQYVAKLANGLAELGWDVDALTVADPPSSLVDPALLASLHPRVARHEAWSLEPTRAVQVLRRRGGDKESSAGKPPTGGGARGYTGLPRWAIRLIQAFFLPDEKVGWSGYARREGRRVAAKRPPVVVVSVGPPFTAHRIARTLARDLRVPWVADLRDPVYGGYFFKPVTPLHRGYMRRFEARIVRDAALVIVATEGMREDLATRYPAFAAKIVTVPNAFDAADFAEGCRQEHEGFEIAYVGTFQATITPDVFLRAVADLSARDPDVARDVRVRFVGPRDPQTDAVVSGLGLDERVERTGFVPHADAVVAMCSADVLLLVLGPEPASSVILTSKLPEYLGARKPVLALVPEGVASRIVEASGAGEVVFPTDVAAVAAALSRLYRLWRDGSLSGPSAEVVASFDAATLMRGLDRQLRALVGKR